MGYMFFLKVTYLQIILIKRDIIYFFEKAIDIRLFSKYLMGICFISQGNVNTHEYRKITRMISTSPVRPLDVYIKRA